MKKETKKQIEIDKKKESKKKENKKENDSQKKGILWKIWLILAIICLVYFVGLNTYTGFTNIFYMIWLPAGICFLVFAWMAKTHFIKNVVPKWITVTMGIIIGLCLVFFIMIEGFILSGFYKTPAEDVDYVIVLGAHAANGKPSRVLKKRLDAALEYALDHKDVKVIVSGGQGSNETTTEAFAMAAYLEENGMGQERILLEEKSTDTNENLRFSKVFVEDGARVAVVSNDFHIFRAVHLARAIGYEDPQGLGARDEIGTLPANLLREFFGVMKDWACGNMKLFPLW